MTDKEALEFGKMWLEMQDDSKNSNTYKFFVTAVKALEQERSRSAEIIQYRYDCEKLMEENEQLKKALEQEPCEDAIRRQAALDAIQKLNIPEDMCVFEIKSHIEVAIATLPPVTPKPKMGRWITKMKSDLRGDMWPTNPKCSECGGEPYYSNTIYNYKFCPYCGAKMEGDK